MADSFSDEQLQEMERLFAPQPAYTLGGLEGIPNDSVRPGGLISPAPYQPIDPSQLYQPSQAGLEDDAGLGLSQDLDPLPSSAPNGQGGSWVDILNGIGGTLEGFSAGYHGRTPLILTQLQQQRQMEQQMGMRRQAQALRLQQLEETKKQHMNRAFIDIMTKPGLSLTQRQGLLKPFADQDPRFQEAIDGIGTQRLGRMATFAKLFPQEMENLNKEWESGNATSEDIDQYLTMLETRQKRKAESRIEATEFSRLEKLAEQSLQTGQPMDPIDQKEFLRMQNERAKAQEELLQLRLKNELAQKKITDPGSDKPDHSEINRVSLAETGKNFDDLPPGGPEQKRVIQAHAERYALGRTNVQMGTPAPTKDRVNYIDRNEFLKHDKLVNPPPGTSEGAIRTGSFVEMTDKQREDWGNLVNSGATLQTLFDEVEPLITAGNSAQAAKQFARLHLEAVTKKNPQAATYLADSEAFSSRMARVFGSEVGVLTNPDVERWRRALPTFGDTKPVLAEKKRIFMSIYKQTKDMYKKKIAGEDYSEDLVGLRRGPLREVDKLAPPSVNDDFNAFFGGK